MVDDILEHFGIPGMKWGRRKSGNSHTHTDKSHVKKSEDISDDAARKNQLKKKKLSQMSNAELKALNERLQLEKQYKTLMESDISPGKKYVAELFKTAAKQTASNYTSKIMTKGVEAAMKTVINL